MKLVSVSRRAMLSGVGAWALSLIIAGCGPTPIQGPSGSTSGGSTSGGSTSGGSTSGGSTSGSTAGTTGGTQPQTNTFPVTGNSGTLSSTAAGGVTFTTTSFRVGEGDFGERQQSFVDFNTAAIPAGATIQSATLTVVQDQAVQGVPFSLGPLVLERVTFNPNTGPTVLGSGASTGVSVATGPFSSPQQVDVTVLVRQARLLGGNPQFRLRFPTDNNNNGTQDRLSLNMRATTALLSITWTS